jgi:hypothetical protein
VRVRWRWCRPEGPPCRPHNPTSPGEIEGDDDDDDGGGGCDEEEEEEDRDDDDDHYDDQGSYV